VHSRWVDGVVLKPFTATAAEAAAWEPNDGWSQYASSAERQTLLAYSGAGSLVGVGRLVRRQRRAEIDCLIVGPKPATIAKALMEELETLARAAGLTAAREEHLGRADVQETTANYSRAEASCSHGSSYPAGRLGGFLGNS
jgi:hypothetical protein